MLSHIIIYLKVGAKMERNQFHTVRGYEIIKKNKKLLTSSMEDYLEMIYRHYQISGYVRIKTLAEQLNVRDSSVTKMVQKIAAIGLLDYEKYGVVTLTEDGKEVGEYLLERHRTVEKFLELLANGDTMLMDVEMIEHNLSPYVIENLKKLISFFESNPEIKAQFDEYKRDSLNCSTED